ncbi:MAG: purine-nucleoside phosphorylase [Oscillospiraceae bacterium]|nr:purine-nucleoside phosphorylase [Oscillospiraceae bacterium]
MSEFKGTPHNTAKAGDFAKTVLMPGDPLRAKYIAENFLEDAKQVNNIRGMLAYTGTYKGKPVSVMGHGMGMPSMGIYCYELFEFYGVENIIRIGSAGSKLPNMSVVVASKVYSNSNFAKTGFGYEENFMLPSEKLNADIVKAAEALGKEVHVGPMSSGDNFYGGNMEERKKFAPAFPEETLAGEMESFALFATARYLGKNAACLVTVTDSTRPDGTKDALPAADREQALRDMMVVALEAAIAQ